MCGIPHENCASRLQTLPVADRRGASIFRLFSPGLDTARDRIAYNFSPEMLAKNVAAFIDLYNVEVARYLTKRPKHIANFVNKEVNWSRNLKRHMLHGKVFEFSGNAIRMAIYRPFVGSYADWS